MVGRGVGPSTREVERPRTPSPHEVAPLLSDTCVRAAKARERRYRLADADGLLLEVLPSGRRVWRYRYRLHGRRRDATLGTYPALGLAAARKARDAMRAQVEGGTDPVDARRDADRRRDGETFEAVALRWLASHGGAGSTVETYERLLRLHLLPSLGARAVGDVDAPMLLDVLRAPEARGYVAAARNARTVAKRVLDFAIAEGLRTSNPARDIGAAMKTRETRHHPAITDPVRFGGLLRALDALTGTATVRNALRLVTLLPLRNVELRTLAWEHVDTDAAVLRLPRGHVGKRKATAFVVPLSRQALAILDEQRDVAPTASPLVFPAVRPGRRMPPTDERRDWTPIGRQTLGDAIRRTPFAGEHTVHGFRSSLKTLGDERLDERLDLLERALTHTVGSTVERAYSRGEHTEQLRALFQSWADYCDRLRAGGDGAADERVVPIGAGRKTSA